MQKEKRRPTLEQLRALPPEIWQLELAQIASDALAFPGLRMDVLEIGGEAMHRINDAHLTPEDVVALREKLKRATGSTGEVQLEAIPFPAA